MDGIDWPERVSGDRAAIVRFSTTAVEADWLDEAAQAIAGRAEPCHFQARLDDGDLGWWIHGDDQLVGALSGKLVGLPDFEPRQALIWTWLAIDARWRAFGYGGAAVPLFEDAARQAGATLALAPLPPDNGVALYFWLRLGYTPLRDVRISETDRPSGVAEDALWMHRPLRDSPDHQRSDHEE